MKKTLVLLTLSTILLFLPKIVSADSGQYGQYGQYGSSAPTQSILIDKQVSRPVVTTKGGVIQYDYVDNLTPSDVRFQPGAFIYFRIKIKRLTRIV